MKKILILILAVVMVISLAACGSDSQQEQTTKAAQESTEQQTKVIERDDGETVPVDVASDEDQIKDLVTTFNTGRDLATLCIFNTSSPGTFKTIVNFYDPLISMDNVGNFIPCLAESWEESSDGLSYTFHIRDGATWTDNKGNVKADVVAEDWLWGMEWVLNYHKNGSYNVTEAIKHLVGAEDYYNYTQGLDEAEAKALGIDKFKEMVSGVETPDDHTVVYNLKERCPYFLSIVTTLGFYSVSGDFLKEIGVDNFIPCTCDQMWYSGPYILKEWVENNQRLIEKNPNWWDTETKRFDSWTQLAVESNDVAYQMYQNGEIHECQLGASYAKIINENPSDPNYGKVVKAVPGGVVFGINFNYFKKNADGTPDENWNKAVANEAFRQCLYYGVDLTGYFSSTNPFEPLSLAVQTMTAYNISKLSDGTDYTDLVLDALGAERICETYPHMDADKTASLKQQAIDELTKEGVTFPVQCDIYCGSGQSAIDEATTFKEDVEDGLGADFIQVNINTYVSSFRQEVVGPQLSSVVLDGYGATYMDPTTYLSQFRSDMEVEQQMVMDYYGNIKQNTDPDLVATCEEYNKMYLEADAISDHDKRLEALSKVEVYGIEHALFIPTRTNRFLFLECINTYTKPVITNDFQSGRFVNIETNVNGYTNEQFEQFYKAYIKE